MNSKLKKLGLLFIPVLSLTNCFFIPEWANFFADRLSESFLSTPTPMLNAYIAIPIVVLFFALFLFAAITVTARLKLRRPEALIYLILLLGLIWPLNLVRETLQIFLIFPRLSYWSHKLVAHKQTSLCVLAGLIFILVSFLGSKKIKPKFVSAVRLLGWVLSPVLIVNTLHLSYALYEGFEYIPKNSPIPKVSQDHLSKRPKIVWIIFDEWDYRLSFEKRPKGLRLPELDRLKAESIFAQNAYPPNGLTLHSIPSLIIGDKVDNVIPRPATLWVHPESPQKEYKKWSELPNIFREVKKLGYSTSVVGWYHTYCRAFNPELDYCRRFPGGRFGYTKSFWETVPAILKRSLILDRRVERSFLFNLQRIRKATLKKIEEDEYDFLFSHFNVPHPPWLKAFNQGTVSVHTPNIPQNYLGNLELMDSLFGEIRRTLENGKDWERTLLILSSDHSWRKASEYDGKQDPRVPLFIKLPHSDGFKELKRPVSTANTAEFILSVLTHQVKNNEEAYSWWVNKSKNFPEDSVVSNQQETLNLTHSKRTNTFKNSTHSSNPRRPQNSVLPVLSKP